MKKIILTALIIVSFTMLVNAQSQKVVSAFNYYKQGQPGLAKENIDAACLNETTMNDAKTWFYKGNIYLLIYKMAHMSDGIKAGLTQRDLELRQGPPLSVKNYKKIPNGSKFVYAYDFVVYLSDTIVDSYEYPNEAEYKKLDDGNTLETAYQAYQKAISIDKNVSNPMMIDIPMPMYGFQFISGLYFNSGIDYFYAKDYQGAYKCFSKSLDINQKLLGVTDNENVIYLAGVCAQESNDTAKAIEMYKMLVSDTTKKPEVYYNLQLLYLGQNKVNRALDVVKKGRAIDPKDRNLLIAEANIYLREGKADEAKKVLMLAIEQDPKNPNLHFAIGTNYDKTVNDTSKTMEIREQAFLDGIVAYKKAIELKPDFFDAYFNLGALMNNKAAELLINAKTLPLSESKKYDELSMRANKILAEAIPFLEKAHELEPKDKNTLILLKSAYFQTKNMEKYKSAKEKLESL